MAGEGLSQRWMLEFSQVTLALLPPEFPAELAAAISPLTCLSLTGKMKEASISACPIP
jgi:hypothetical protein